MSLLKKAKTKTESSNNFLSGIGETLIKIIKKIGELLIRLFKYLFKELLK